MTIIGAIEGGGTKFVVGIGTPDGKVEAIESFPTTTPEETMGRVVEYFKNKQVDAIGFGSFGPIVLNRDSDNYGHIAKTPKPHWGGYDVVGHLKRHFDVPIGFDTDVNGAALGESIFGAAQGLKSCLYITIGTGIGAGAVVEGKLVHGLAHPEMGHIMVKRHPEDTYEGKCPYHKDCLEGLAAGPGIEERWGVKAYELSEDHKAWEFQTFYIAQALMNYILTVSPEKIILGGGVSKQQHLFPRIREQLKTLLNGYVDHPAVLDTNSGYIIPPGLGDHAGITGAVALGLQALAEQK